MTLQRLVIMALAAFFLGYLGAALFDRARKRD
jgi:hypothetical protein